MVILQATDLHWIKGAKDNPRDLCAHSPIDFRIGDEILVKPKDGDWTVSTAALYLLRTCADSHSKNHPLVEHLFPCCGHAMFDAGGENVEIVECCNGMDFEVIHEMDDIFVTSADKKFKIPLSEWKFLVAKFSDQIHDFYKASSAKQPFDENEKKGLEKFMSEWDRRRKDLFA